MSFLPTNSGGDNLLSLYVAHPHQTTPVTYTTEKAEEV